jgi:UDP-N-acetylmuramoyl-L-alanyl-D-glutamate--2,6-diaminopimelate ligase
MMLPELLRGWIDTGVPEIEIAGLALDSRKVAPGEVFVAVQGSVSHGIEFAPQALANGCVAILWEPVTGLVPPSDLGDSTQLVAVPQLSQRLGELAARLYRHPSQDLTVIGVTGTNGKSSCVHFIAQSLESAGRRCGTLGTLGVGLFGDEIPATHTTPDAINVQHALRQFSDAGADLVAMEVSSHALHQGRANGVDFDAAIFTNLTRDHLDYHPDMDHYLGAKSRLFTSPGLRFAIINADDPSRDTLVSKLAADVELIEYGIEAGAVRAEQLSLLEGGLAFDLALPGGSYPVTAGLLGRFNAYNLLAVAATLMALGWQGESIAQALRQLRPVPGRMNLIGGGPQPLVVVDYAHTPDALAQSIGAVRDHVSGLLTLVFGCGGDRDPGKRPMMAAAAENGADRLVITDDNPRGEDGDAIVANILAGLTMPDRAQVIRDRATAISTAIGWSSPGDVVLVAGKGHETYQEVMGQRREFDDRAAALDALGGES